MLPIDNEKLSYKLFFVKLLSEENLFRSNWRDRMYNTFEYSKVHYV